MNAAQALDFRRPLQSSAPIEKLHAEFRSAVPFISKDRLMYPDIHRSIEFLHKNKPQHFLKA
jgi:histidine ammonia-lyase